MNWIELLNFQVKTTKVSKKNGVWLVLVLDHLSVILSSFSLV